MFHEGWNSLKLWENVKATCENKSNKFSINVTVQYHQSISPRIPTGNTVSFWFIRGLPQPTKQSLLQIWAPTSYNMMMYIYGSILKRFVYMCVDSLYIKYFFVKFVKTLRINTDMNNEQNMSILSKKIVSAMRR